LHTHAGAGSYSCEILVCRMVAWLYDTRTTPKNE